MIFMSRTPFFLQDAEILGLSSPGQMDVWETGQAHQESATCLCRHKNPEGVSIKLLHGVRLSCLLNIYKDFSCFFLLFNDSHNSTSE